MKVAAVRKQGQPPIIEERSIPEPGAREARIRVHACGICHSDQFVVEGLWPGLSLPRVPGHEVAGGGGARGVRGKASKTGPPGGGGGGGGELGGCFPWPAGGVFPFGKSPRTRLSS